MSLLNDEQLDQLKKKSVVSAGNWRVGEHERGPLTPVFEGDRFVGEFVRPTDARTCVEAVNAAAALSLPGHAHNCHCDGCVAHRQQSGCFDEEPLRLVPGARPGERGQRVSTVSDARLRYIISDAWKPNESTQICQELLDARAEIAALRSAREAGLRLSERLAEALGTERREVIAEAVARIHRFQDIIGWQPGESRNALIGDIEAAVLALEPPESLAAEVGGPEPAKTEGGRDV